MKKIKSYDEIFSLKEKETIIKDYINNFLTIKEICEKYNIKSKGWIKKLLGDKTRNISEANKIAHKKYPNSFKHSEETKNKMRESRLKWMKNHPEQTAWRQKNMSYPEKCFKKILEDNKLNEKYLIYREYSVFPYFIDFAFVDEKIAVEIDGSQHLEENRKKKDIEKDKLLKSNGWRIIRIQATEVIRDGTKALDVLLDMLGDSTTKYKIVGCLKAPKTRQKLIRGKDGLTEKERNRAFKQRKVNWPSKEELIELIKNEPFTTIAKRYGVSDRAVAKWCKRYGLPHRKKDINKKY
jgi:very-short-patch-repair endonuclease